MLRDAAVNSRRRSEAEFTEVMRTVAPDLLAYFERRVGADAADLLTELMLIAWRKGDQLPAQTENARMWLFGIARNVLRNSQRSTVRRDRTNEALRLLTERTARQPDHVEAIEIRDLITRLDPDLAEVVLLVHWDGFNHAEIGQLLDVPASTIRGRYQRAKAALRAELSVSHGVGDT
jgi:RNA polymerase sigma factor (sigma-70 family)